MKLPILAASLLATLGLVSSPMHQCSQNDVLRTMQIVYLEDGLGNKVPTLRISGVNVQIVNGMGSTDTTNGTGNLIVGYNNNDTPNFIHERTGSHNLIMGDYNDYYSESYGSIVTGYFNHTSQPHSSIIASQYSLCDGPFSTITGADGGIVLFPAVFGNVLGGEANAAVAHHSTVTGGLGNFINVNGPWGTVSGGWIRTVFTPRDWAAGSLYENEPDN